MSKKNRWMGGLPSGRMTRSQQEYIDAWREFGRPFADALHAELVGFDPGLLLMRGNRSFDLNMALCQSLRPILVLGLDAQRQQEQIDLCEEGLGEAERLRGQLTMMGQSRDLWRGKANDLRAQLDRANLLMDEIDPERGTQ